MSLPPLLIECTLGSAIIDESSLLTEAFAPHLGADRVEVDRRNELQVEQWPEGLTRWTQGRTVWGLWVRAGNHAPGLFADEEAWRRLVANLPDLQWILWEGDGDEALVSAALGAGVPLLLRSCPTQNAEAAHTFARRMFRQLAAGAKFEDAFAQVRTYLALHFGINLEEGSGGLCSWGLYRTQAERDWRFPDKRPRSERLGMADVLACDRSAQLAYFLRSFYPSRVQRRTRTYLLEGPLDAVPAHFFDRVIATHLRPTYPLLFHTRFALPSAPHPQAARNLYRKKLAEACGFDPISVTDPSRIPPADAFAVSIQLYTSRSAESWFGLLEWASEISYAFPVPAYLFFSIIHDRPESKFRRRSGGDRRPPRRTKYYQLPALGLIEKKDVLHWLERYTHDMPEHNRILQQYFAPIMNIPMPLRWVEKQLETLINIRNPQSSS